MGDTAHGECIDRVVARNGHDALAVAHHDVLSLAHDSETGLLQRAHGVEVVDAGEPGQDYRVTSTSRTSSRRSCSSTTERYSRIASRILSTASCSVSP